MKNNNLHVLVVDDNPGDQFLISELLGETYLQISAIEKAVSVRDAVTLLQQKPVDIVLLDLSLPDAQGIDTFLQVNKYAKNIPVVILSGLNDLNTATDAISLGAQDFLMKGEFNEKLLEKTILYSIERKKTLLELRFSNERYEFVSKATNDLVWDWDVLNNKVHRNEEQFVKILKLPAELRNENNDFWNSRIHPDEGDLKDKILGNLERDKSATHFEEEYRFLRGDGEYIYVIDKGYAVRNEQGQVIRIIGSLQDITESKKAEAQLRESEEKYRLFFNSIPASVFIWSLDDYNILEVNETATENYGYSRQDFLKMSMLDIRREEDRKNFTSFAKEAKNECFTSTSRLWKHINNEGEEMYMQIVSNKIEYNNRSAIMAIASNVTEKIKLERKLEEEKQKMEQEITRAVIIAQEKEREEIGRELHDNVNQILASSRLYLGLVKDKGVEYKSFIEESDVLIHTAIQEIRHLSHALIPPAMQDADLEKSINSLINIVQEGSGIIVSKEVSIIDKSIMSEQLKLTIYRILQEQVNNILKYAKASTMEIQLLQCNEKILLRVRDNGIGFDPEQKTDGVGLMNIRTRAALQKGDVKMITSPGNGCELFVEFNLSCQ
ncbi:hybrid sensor histidine kinase/response regulator [Lacibacter sediminis]|uniref:histidine kinase n=1 Tax=Lacibacter sediminis TaxID=2760713 RepID=A0A7G5XIH9_9BACT|nr:PAS domain S-box protein [Lacibacter sediminis]QNA45282.1 PAS domain S-box protein [Lacibacter sediminis]